MTQAPPVIPGYVRAHLLMTKTELADIKDELGRFAENLGYSLGRVFVERIDQVPAAFAALLEVIEQDRPEAVVVPSALHLAVLGLPPKIMYYLHAVTGTRVLLVNAPPVSAPHIPSGSAT
jgi:hypothetical protein